MAQDPTPIKPLDEILGLPATAEPAAPKPGSWRTQGAVSSRVNPVTNTIDFVENVNGSVRSWKPLISRNSASMISSSIFSPLMMSAIEPESAVGMANVECGITGRRSKV